MDMHITPTGYTCAPHTSDIVTLSTAMNTKTIIQTLKKSLFRTIASDITQ